jgi:copper chaperone CopZ
MYGDHHVTEVRRLLLALPGVEDVYASSGFRAVEVSYDPAKLAEDAIRSALDDAGYLGELLLPAETATPATEKNGKAVYFRHTMAYSGTGRTVSFGQSVVTSGRALWPCPGVGPLKLDEEE